MSNRRCVAVVLAVICLPAILLSLEAHAQPTVDDDTTTCGSSALQELTIEIRDTHKDVKRLLASKPRDFDTGEPSKLALVSALVCECFVSV